MTVAELDTQPLLEVRGLEMHFPVSDLTRSVRPCLGETRRRSRLALGRGYRGDGWDVRQILLDYLFSFGHPASIHVLRQPTIRPPLRDPSARGAPLFSRCVIVVLSKQPGATYACQARLGHGPGLLSRTAVSLAAKTWVKPPRLRDLGPFGGHGFLDRWARQHAFAMTCGSLPMSTLSP